MTVNNGTRLRTAWPLAASILLFLVLLSTIVSAGMRLCDGKLIYPMDDTYIHLATAKNLALHGVWGITRYAFTSSISSPLFTLLIAIVFRLIGVHEWVPLALNVIAGILLLYVTDIALKRAAVKPLVRFACMAIVVVGVPLPILAVSGMEHVVQTLLLFVFLALYIPILLEPAPPGRTFTWLLLVTAALVMARYEGVGTVSIAGLLLIIRRKWFQAALLGLAAFVPLAAFAWLSVAHGWYAIPNSILIKANMPHRTGTIPALLAGLAFNAHMAPWLPWLIPLPACLAYIAWRRNRTMWNSTVIGLILLAGSVALHLTFARVGWFFRYEAYLIAWAIVWSFIAWPDCRPALFHPSTVRPAFASWLAAAGVVVSALMFVYFDARRADEAFANASLAMKNVYDQPYQLGLFARDELPGATLLVDDMGAISFLSDDRILDVVGLGSIEPVIAMRHGAFNAAWLDAWLKREHADAALVHITGPWSVAPLPSWIPAGSWTIPDNYVLACDTAHVYALQPSAKAEVESGFRNFRSKLPRDIGSISY